MIYPVDFEQRIGFDQVRQTLAGACVTDSAREAALRIPFLTDYESLRTVLGQTREMRDVLTLETDFPGGGYKDLNAFLSRIRIEGTFLETAQLSELHKGLELLESMTSFFKNKRTDGGDPYPLLTDLVEPISGFEPVIREIDRILDSFGRIKDNASPELTQIRRSLREKSGQIEKRLHAILREAKSAGLVDEDTEVSVRDGRAVIPVAAGNKRKIKGLVLDESATGRTAFIEPMEVVELNNEVRELENAEKREIQRILMIFTEQWVRPRLSELLDAGEYLTQMDLIHAKGKYALKIGGVLPFLSADPVIEIYQARHPLLEAALKRENKPIVPLDLWLNPKKHILLISGPNAGGKSVCLKTVGLLQYMLQCGLLVPLKEDSRMGIFQSLFIDIGDQQSLDNDLSTYSSHLLNMKTMLRSADHRSLVLIDEFGSGTEPGTGGAIAESVLERLEKRKVWGVITTHYANLKYYAASAEGIENGAMAFDLQRIEPLFRLEIGRPGSSFAFEIARKIGLPEDLIHDAEEKMGTDQARAEKHIREAARDKRYWEGKRERIRLAEKAVDRTAAEYEAQLTELKTKQKEIIEQARRQAQELVAEANRRIENTIREIKESQAQKERTRASRAQLEEFREVLTQANDTGTDAIDRKMEKLREKKRRREERKAQRGEEDGNSAVTPSRKEPAPPGVGMMARIKGQSVVGEILEITGKKATVAFNHMSTVVDLSKLETVNASEIKRSQVRRDPGVTGSAYDTSKKRLNFKRQIDLRGVRTADALQEVTDYIDEAIVLGIPQVSILHGKGTGALKEEIRKYLRTVPLVVSAADEHEEFGGAGITVVVLEV